MHIFYDFFASVFSFSIFKLIWHLVSCSSSLSTPFLFTVFTPVFGVTVFFNFLLWYWIIQSVFLCGCTKQPFLGTFSCNNFLAGGTFVLMSCPSCQPLKVLTTLWIIALAVSSPEMCVMLFTGCWNFATSLAFYGLFLMRSEMSVLCFS